MAIDISPDGWTQRRLGACATVNAEQLGAKTDPDFVLEYLDIGAIERTGTVGNSRTLSFGDAPSRARRLVREGDILVSTVRPYLRNFGRVRQAPDNLVASTGYAVIRPSDDVDGDFLYQHILSDSFVGFLKPRMRGSSYPAVTAGDVGAYPLSLPPLAQQRRIGAVLCSVDDAIERVRAVSDQAKVVKRGLMQELLTQGLPGRHMQFKQSPIGSVPSQWTIVPLIEACEAPGQYGANVAKGVFSPGGVRYIRITDIESDGTLKEEAVGIDAKIAEKYLLKEGDLLLARSGTVGKSYLHGSTKGVPCAFAGYLVRFRTKTELLLPTFLKEYVGTAAYWRWVAERRRVGAQPNINAVEYGQLPVPCPPLDEQRAIVEIATALDSAVWSTNSRIARLEELKRALMSVLLTGELPACRHGK